MDLKYRIVVFLEKPKNQKLLDVDIIPVTWLVFKENDPDGFYCKFMKGPFTAGRIAQLKKKVMNCESREKDWPIFAIEIRGRAATYQEAEKRVLELQHKPHAYTSDTDGSALTKGINDKKALRLKNCSDADGVKMKLDGVSMNLKKSIGSQKRRRSSTSSKSEDEPNASVSSTISTTDDENENGKRKTKLVSKKKRGQSGRTAEKKKKLPVEFSDDDEVKKREKLPSSRDSRMADNIETGEKTSTSTQRDPNLSSQSIPSGTSEFEVSTVNESTVTEKDVRMPKVKGSTEINNTQDFRGVLRAIIQSHNVLSKQIAKGNGLITELNLRAMKMEENIARLIRDHQGINNERNIDDMSDGELVEPSKEPIEMPIKSLDDFTRHEKHLKTNSYRKKMMYRMLSIVSDKLSLTKNIGNILRTYMSRDIAMQFTSVKPMPNKQVFKSTQIYCCIKGKESAVARLTCHS